MSDPTDFAERKLARLGARTEDIVPAEGFDDWILERVERPPAARTIDSGWRVGRWALVAAAVAAAASLVVASETASLLDERVITAFGLEEVDE